MNPDSIGWSAVSALVMISSELTLAISIPSGEQRFRRRWYSSSLSYTTRVVVSSPSSPSSSSYKIKQFVANNICPTRNFFYWNKLIRYRIHTSSICSPWPKLYPSARMIIYFVQLSTRACVCLYILNIIPEIPKPITSCLYCLSILSYSLHTHQSYQFKYTLTN